MSNNSKNKEKEHSKLKWFIQIFITTFILSITFSFISTNALNNLALIPAILILMLVIFIGIRQPLMC